MRTKSYQTVKELASKAVRAAADATAMLVSGKRRLDVELRRLRGDAAELQLSLSEQLMGGGLPAPEITLLLQLSAGLCQVLQAALETAALLRGRSVRAWGLFDRVRVSAALTERLADLTALLGCGERELPRSMREFSETNLRLSALALRAPEETAEEGQTAFALSEALARWHTALTAAHASLLGLLAMRQHCR